MHLVSTRGKSPETSFEEALFSGLASDGGLYRIADPPDLTALFSSLTPGMSFLDVATALSTQLLGDELNDESGSNTAEQICRKAFTFAPALSSFEPGIELLELYHGPSAAFKDFGASFLAASMSHFLGRTGRKAIILTATSGDTGSAVAQAFSGRNGIEVVILYPSGRVSPLQEKQLTTVGGNVHALEVSGTFDDCQRMVKEAFRDEKLKAALPLTSANSISIGRLLPQSFYYAYATAQRKEPVRFCVPSGNFGNLTAGVMARQWGMQCSGFIAATNANDVVPEYLRTSRFSPRPSVRTLSNAMDVGDPSNFERLLSIFGGDHAKLSNVVEGAAVTDEETTEEIRAVYEKTGRFLCPHTAVGTLAARRCLKEHPGERIITLATAHPAKFGEVIERATGVRPELPERLEAALRKKKVATGIKNSLDALREYLLQDIM